MTELLESIVTALMGGGVTIITASVIWYLRQRGECMKAMKKKIERVDKRSWKVGKALILALGMIDKQTNKNHPEIESELRKLAQEIIKESDYDE